MYEQKETTSGYLCYVHKQTGEQENDNPQFVDLMHMIHEKHRSIKYVTYRCATKIWFLKQSLYTINIPYNLVSSVLNHHGFIQLKPSHLTALIHDVYFAASKCDLFKESVNFNLDRCTAMLANLFWNVYDPNRTVSLSLLEFNQIMLVLCNTQHFERLTVEEFNLAADHNRCVNRFRLESIIKVIAKFFIYLEENTIYRTQSITTMIKECFEQCPGIIGLTEPQFIDLWKKQHIAFSHYSNVLALVYRIKESQNIVHDSIVCVNCKQSPIVGIRFKCQQCRKLSLCFECFCTGYKTSKHEISHRMYEISTNVTKNHIFSWMCSCLCKLFCCVKNSVQQEKSKNITMETEVVDEDEVATVTTIIDCVSDTKWGSMRSAKQPGMQIEPLSVNNHKTESITAIVSNEKLAQLFGEIQIQEDQLNMVIQSLLQQAEELKKYMAMSGKKRKNHQPDFLSEHQAFLDDITYKLRNLNLPKSVSSTSTLACLPQSSTPYRTNCDRKPFTFSVGSQIANSIYGVDSTVDKSHIEDNRSDWTLADISSLLQSKPRPIQTINNLKVDDRASNHTPDLPPLKDDDGFETELQNFKELLNKIRDIMDDSYSDNCDLSTAAKRLEDALDSIIRVGEQKRPKAQ